LIRLRFSERVLLHLVESQSGQFNGLNSNSLIEPPFSLTQSGISEALEYSLERVSTSLRELMSEGLVVMKKYYSRESGRFRSFYFPTQDGVLRARELMDAIRAERVKVIDLDGTLKEMSVEELLGRIRSLSGGGDQDTYLLKEGVPLPVTYTSVLNSIRGETFEVERFISPRRVDLNKKMWTMVRDAYFDATNRYVVLTRNQHWQAGALWLRDGIKVPFTAEFRYRAGGGSGGDGFVFMFYKKKDYWPCEGGNLGFVPGTGPSPGYGVEFDSLPNPDYNDPPYPHIALMKDRPDNHLTSVEDRRVADFKWHSARISVGESSVSAWVDGDLVLRWNGELDRSHTGVGIAASTGGMTNWHIVDDIKITKAREESG